MNTWLNETLLPEDQVASTAIATELHYAEKNIMYVVSKDGDHIEVPFLPQNAQDANSSMITNGDYAICTSHSDKLLEARHLILVDMPGTDSGIKRHTEALFRYAHKGIAYLLVIDPIDGTVPNSLISFLSGLNLEHKSLLVALSKSDKYTEEHLNMVEESVRTQLSAFHTLPLKLIRTSDRDSDTQRRFHKLLMELNHDELCINTYRLQVIVLAHRLINHIETIRDNSELDTYEISKKIQELIEVKREVERAFEREVHKLSHELRTHTLENIIIDVSRALNQNVDELSDILARNDQQTFANKVSSIVDQVTKESLQKNISMNIDVFLGEINKSLSLSADDISQTLKVSAEGVKTLTEGIIEVVKNGGTAYKIATTILAVTTSVVMPLIELVIIFLPDIIQAFSNPEEERQNVAMEMLTNKIFPKIRAQLRQELSYQIPKIEQEILKELQNEWQNRIEESNTALEVAKSKKTLKESNWKQMQEQYNSDIKTINELLNIFETYNGGKK